MPSIRRKQHRLAWGDTHRAHLVTGAIAGYQRFGEQLRVVCRQRYHDGEDFSASTMPLAAAAWSELRDEILAGVEDPKTVWAFRRFG